MSLQFPQKFEADLTEAKRIYESVEKTHQGCGKLALMEILCDASHRTLLVIGTSGTGKSAVMKWLRDIISRDKIWLDAITVSGLKHLAKRLSGKNMTILIDDLSKGGTYYSQVMTVCCIGELCYTGFIRKYTAQLDLVIEGFRGSAIINAQPLILKRLLKADEFETDIRDKVIRYYHLRRPIQVTLSPPADSVKYSYLFYHIPIPPELYKHQLMKQGHELFRYEFSKARAEEHFNALIRASALINHRKHVTVGDLWLVNQLCRNFILESELFSKDDLEGERKLDPNIIPLMSVLATHKKYPFTNLMQDFQVKQTRLYQIIAENSQYVALIKNSGNKVIIPTRAGQELLKKMGEW